MAFPFRNINDCRVTCVYNKIGSEWASGKHDGIDIVSDGDKTVLSVSDGKVIRCKYTLDGWGQYVVVQMPDGRAIVYGHLVRDSQKVVVGDNVKVGQVIGTMGKTGHTDGAHLHIELQKRYYAAGVVDDIAEFLGIENELGKPELLEEEEMQTTYVRIELPTGEVMNIPGYIVDGSSFLQIRPILEKLGFEVGWRDGKITIQ